MSKPNKHALVIGINKYPYMKPKFQLRGCVNDTYLIRDTLMYKFNFPREQIKLLHDEAATRDNILKEMNDLVRRVNKNDVVVFHYSGHGHRCTSKTKDTDEGSGKDNCLLPHDDSIPGANGKPEYREIRDDVINQWLQKLVNKTNNITLIFDACHSGTMTRSANDAAKARSVPESERQQIISSASRKKVATKLRRGAGGWLALNNNYVVISGCRDTQTSKERWFSEGKMKYRHGVLTYSLIGALNRATPGTTYRDIFESVCSKVPASAANQNPQIEGKIDRVLFGVKDIEPLPFLSVASVAGSIITIAGGAAHGLRVGDKWKVYPASTKDTETTGSLGMATMTSVGATTAKAKFNGAGVVEQGCRCVAVKNSIKLEPLRVSISSSNLNPGRALTASLKRSTLLEVVDNRNIADVDVKLLARNSAALKALNKTLGLTGNKVLRGDVWAAFYDDGTLAFPPREIEERAVATRIRSNLDKIAKFRRVLKLDNPATGLKAEFNLYKRSASDKYTKVNGGGAEFKAGESMMLEITNHEKDRSLFFSLIWLSADHSIQQFYPPRKNCEEIAPGKTVRIGHGKRRLNAAIGSNVISDTITETCKLMITSSETDFRWLTQTATRSSGEQSSSIKEFDLAVRGSKKKVIDNPKDDWDAINRSLVIHRNKPKRR